MSAPAAGAKRLRVYQSWQGNERFFCWGYWVAGPNWKSVVGSVLLVLAPAIVFNVFVAPYLGEHVSWAILVISLILPALSLVWLIRTACQDPGILPRQEPDEEWLAGRQSRTKDFLVNNHRVSVRYNDTCHFFQPPRAHHCSVNDNCVERFDHHCPWVGTTVGLRNYRTFLLFVYNTTVLDLWVFGCSLGMLFVKHDELTTQYMEEGKDTADLWVTTLGKCGPALTLLVYTFIFFWFVGGLSAFHCYLVATNQTTYENFRYNHNNQPNPYDQGCMSNCAEVWCTPLPASRISFRAFVDDYKPSAVVIPFPAYTEPLGSSYLPELGNDSSLTSSTIPASNSNPLYSYTPLASQRMDMHTSGNSDLLHSTHSVHDPLVTPGDVEIEMPPRQALSRKWDDLDGARAPGQTQTTTVTAISLESVLRSPPRSQPTKPGQPP